MSGCVFLLHLIALAPTDTKTKKGGNHIIIGITERGDAALNMSWTKKLHTVDGIIAITKNLTDEFIEKTDLYA